MKIGTWGGLLLAAAMLLAGCGDFWQAPNGGGNGEYTITNSGNISVTPGATTANTATITVTPESSFSGTVSLSCSVSSPSGATDPTTCSLSPSSLSVSGSTAQTSTLTATTGSDTTTGAYEITITGAASGYSSETTTVCVEVSTSSGTCGSSSGSASGVFYVLNQTTEQIVATTVTSGSPGSATEVATTLAAAPLAIAVAPNGKFLYVSTALGIYLYTIGSNGALTVGNGGSAISSDPATTMQVDSTDSWLVDAVTGTNELFAIAVNPDSGVLTSVSEQAFPSGLPATTPTQLAISPGDSSSCGNCYVFVAMGAGGTELIHFDPANSNPFGGSGHINVINGGGADNAVAVDPNNLLVYVGESVALSGAQTGGLRAFSYTSSGYTEISGSPYSSQGTGPISIQPSADGNYVYVANQAVSGSANDNIASYSVSSNSLTYIATATAGPEGQIALAEDSTQSYLLAVDFEGNPELEAYSMSSGTLTSVLTATTGTGTVGAFAIAELP